MNETFEQVKDKVSTSWNYLVEKVGIPTMLVIAVLSVFILLTYYREWQLKEAISKQDERVEQYRQQSNEAVAIANDYLEMADKNHQATVGLVDVVKGLTDNIKQLAENDRIINVKVNDSKQEYENSRNQKRSNPTAAAKSNVPLRQREDNVLAADRELYPD